MMSRIWKSLALITVAAFFCVSTPALAQKLGEGSGAKSMSASEYQKKLQLSQEETSQKETGNLSEGAQEIKDAEQAYEDAERKALEAARNLDVKGYFSNAWDGFKKGIKRDVTLFKNMSVSGNEMTYTNPVTGEEETYVRTEWGTNIATEGVLKGCSPLGVQIIENRSCIFCPLFAVLYDAANSMSELAFSKLAKAISNVMLVGFALIIAFKGLSFVSSMTKQDAPKFIMEVLTLSLKVTICFILLSDAHQIYQYFIVPVLGAGLEFGSAMLFSGGDQVQACAAAVPISGDTALLPLALYAKLDCFIRSIQGEISIMQSVGSSLMCVGRNVGAEDNFIWDFGMVFQGLIIWGFAVLLSLAFAFYLIDATVTLGLVGALMPLLIGSWPFKWTTGYTQKGIQTFLNTFFVYVFMGVVVSINVQLIGTALNGDSSSSASSQTETTTPPAGTPPAGTATDGGAAGASSSSGAMAGLMEAIQANEVDKLEALTDIGFGGFLILLCCCIFGFKFSAQATTLAEKMSGGGISINKIGSNIGGMAASGAMGLAKKATQPARKAVSNKAGELSDRAGSAIGKRMGIGKHGGKTGDKNAPAPEDKKTPPPGGGKENTANNKRSNKGSNPSGGDHGAKGGGKGGKGKGGKGKGGRSTTNNNNSAKNLKDLKNQRKKK